MKRTRLAAILCLALLLCVSFIPVRQAQASATAWIKTPLGGNCCWREGPGKKYTEIGQLAYRTKLTVYSYSGNWAYVKPEGSSLKGYVSTSFLVYEDPGAFKGKSSQKNSDATYASLDKTVKGMKLLKDPYYTVISTSRSTNLCHLRWFPCSDGRVIGKYRSGEQVLVLAEGRTWCQVQVVKTGYVGFVLSASIA